MDLQLPVHSVPITTNVMCSNLADSEVYPIQYYLIKLVSSLRWFSPGNPDCYDITEMLLNVALNTVNQPIVDNYTV